MTDAAPPPTFRRATRADLPAIVRLLADDALGATRETVSDPLPASYHAAFDEIERDPNQELVVVALPERDVAGVMQLSFIPYLTHRGSRRAQIEGVRIASDLRDAGLGRRMIEWAISRARERGCSLVQLTSDKQRPDAIRFYGSLGFLASHEGMKLRIEPGTRG